MNPPANPKAGHITVKPEASNTTAKPEFKTAHVKTDYLTSAKVNSTSAVQATVNGLSASDENKNSKTFKRRRSEVNCFM